MHPVMRFRMTGCMVCGALVAVVGGLGEALDFCVRFSVSKDFVC